MTEKVAIGLAGMTRAMRAVLGVPDYARYVDHFRLAHPDLEPMACEDFMNERLEDRYNRPGAKCC